MIAGTYNAGLVVLSILIAIVASYAAFNLGERVFASTGRRRWAWLTSGAIAMGFAIWSMHYVGMLAFVLPVPVLYHVPTVVLSLLAAVPGAAVALYIVSKKTMQAVDTAIVGVCLGAAVVAMHYSGMAAMRSAAMHHYRPNLVILSVVVAVTFSSVAAWLAFRFGRLHEGFTWTRFGGASLMGLGIASMHYTAMAAAYFMPGYPPPLRHTVEVSTLGAFSIGITTLLLLGTALATAWFDRRLQNERLLQRLYRELRDVINTVPAHAWSALPDGNIDFVNQRWQQFTGLPPEDALGWNWEVVLHPDDRAKFIGDWRAALSSGQPMETEVRTRRADGEYRCLLIRNVPLRDELGNILKWYGTGLDIEDRKQAEALLAGEKRILELVARGDSLAEILRRLCLLVEELASGALASILLLDGNRLRHGSAPSLPKAYTDAIDGAAIGPSAGSCGTAAYLREQVIVEDITTDPLWANYRELALPHGLRACWSTPIISSQGSVLATFATYYREPRKPNRRDQEIIEQITHLAGVAIERKLTQEKLRRSEAYLAEAQRLTRTGSWAWAPNAEGGHHGWHYWSEEMFRIFEFDPHQGPPAREMWWQRIHPGDRQQIDESIQKALREKGEYANDYCIVLSDGRMKCIHAIGHPVFNDAGEIVEFVGTSVDLTEQKRTEEALRLSEAYLSEGQRLTHTGSWALNIVTREALHSSAEHSRLFGFDPEKGTPSFEAFLQRVHPEDQEHVIQAFQSVVRSGGDLDLRYRIAVPGGPVRYMHAVGHPVLKPSGATGEYVGIAIDVTERRRADQERERLRHLEADLAHMNRVSMMGELAASLGHEIKQPIAAAITNANTCLRWLKRDQPNLDEAREAASRMVQDAMRSVAILNRTSALYKKGTPQRELIDINEVINEITALLHNEASRWGVSILSHLASDLPKTVADRVQLQQVLLNLAINGIDAMRQVEGTRELRLSSKRDTTGGIVVCVADTGVGLPPETNRVFDAFFTTKSDGMGMGLAVSRTIIESHGGSLLASPNPGRGAMFSFTLPIAAAGASA
jgi:PAS domain S-box-containing protein